MKRKALVTGPRGYLASLLIKSLEASERFEIWTLDRSQDGSALPFCTIGSGREKYSGDLRDPNLLADFADHRSVVFSIGADTNRGNTPLDAYQLVESNSLLPTLLGAHGTNFERIIHTGTYSYRSADEPFKPADLYSASKYTAELMLQYFTQVLPLEVDVLHLYDIYGPAQPHKRLIPYLLESIRQDQVITLKEPLRRLRPVYVDDVVSCMLQASESVPDQANRFRTHDVYGPQEFQVSELPAQIAGCLRSHGEFVKANLTPIVKGGESTGQFVCHDLFPAETFEWTSFSEGIRTLV